MNIGAPTGAVPPEDPIQTALNHARYLLGIGNIADAENQLRVILRAAPGHAAASHLLGKIAGYCGQPQPAIALISKALKQDPNLAGAWADLAEQRVATGQLCLAIGAAREELKRDPNHPQARVALLKACFYGNDYPACAAELDRIIALKAPDTETLRDAARFGFLTAHYRQAETLLRQILALNPDDLHAQQHLPLLLLPQGKWREAWPLYKGRAIRRDRVQSPQWDGERLTAGQTLLILGEQGFGDGLLFARYLSAVAKRAGTAPIVQISDQLVRLFSDISALQKVCSLSDPSPKHDVHIFMGDLPGLFESAPGAVIGKSGYLTAPQSASPLLPPRTQPLRVGLCWKSMSGHENADGKSLPGNLLAPLFDVAGIEWVSLQFDRQEPLPGPMSDGAALCLDFYDTARLLKELDLVISIDTALSHLAGAIGMPCWVGLNHIPDWRWLPYAEEQNAWYDSVRPFYQTQTGGWHSVIEQMTTALKSLHTSL